MKTTPIIPRMWVATLPKDAPRLAHGPDRSLRLISPSVWERLLPIGDTLFVRHDIGQRPFTRVYTVDEYRAYWKRKLLEGFEPLGLRLLLELKARTGFQADLTEFADFAESAFNRYSGEYQLVVAVYQMLLGDLAPTDYAVNSLIVEEDKSRSIEELMLLPSNYASFRQRDMLLRIAFAFFHRLPVGSQTVTLLIGQLTATNELHNFHKIKF